MKLLNTIEIEPWVYSEHVYESPSVSKAENQKAEAISGINVFLIVIYKIYNLLNLGRV